MNFRYKNRRTGNVIDVPCRLEGPDWQEITEAKAETAAAKTETEPEAAPAKAKAAPKRKARATD